MTESVARADQAQVSFHCRVRPLLMFDWSSNKHKCNPGSDCIDSVAENEVDRQTDVWQIECLCVQLRVHHLARTHTHTFLSFSILFWVDKRGRGALVQTIYTHTWRTQTSVTTSRQLNDKYCRCRCCWWWWWCWWWQRKQYRLIWLERIGFISNRERECLSKNENRNRRFQICDWMI